MAHAGDPFRTLYDANHERVRRVLARIVGPQEAEDLTQTVFAKAAKALPRFRGDAETSTWLYRIAANVASDWLRGRTALFASVVLGQKILGERRCGDFGEVFVLGNGEHLLFGQAAEVDAILQRNHVRARLLIEPSRCRRSRRTMTTSRSTAESSPCWRPQRPALLRAAASVVPLSTRRSAAPGAMRCLQGFTVTRSQAHNAARAGSCDPAHS